jgi:hypothetical protein
MKLTLKALKFLGGLFAKGTVLASAWALSLVLVMTSANAMDFLSAIGTRIGASSVHLTQKQQARQTRTAAKEVGKKMGKRTKRILAVNTIGGLTGWFPLIGDAVAMGAMAYEAVLICENSNDFRELQRTIGVEPDNSFIGTNCEQAQDKWDDTAQWVKVLIIVEVDKEVEKEPRSGRHLYKGCPFVYRNFETPPCGVFTSWKHYEEALEQWEASLPLHYRIKWEWRQFREMAESEEVPEELLSLGLGGEETNDD